jgi:hypothetical protein
MEPFDDKPYGGAKRARFSGTERTVINGPFSPAQEQTAGYRVWRVKFL